jgi:hypothetical protein
MGGGFVMPTGAVPPPPLNFFPIPNNQTLLLIFSAYFPLSPH